MVDLKKSVNCYITYLNRVNPQWYETWKFIMAHKVLGDAKIQNVNWLENVN